MIDVTGINRQTGRSTVGGVNCPGSKQSTSNAVFKYFIRGSIIDNPQRRTVRYDALWAGIAAVKSETTGCILISTQPRRSIDVFVDLIGFTVDDPNIDSVCGNSLRYRIRRHRPG